MSVQAQGRSVRKSIDCRLYPSEKGCTLKISGSEEEVLAAASAHAIAEHGHADTPELRSQLRALLKKPVQSATISVLTRNESTRSQQTFFRATY